MLRRRTALAIPLVVALLGGCSASPDVSGPLPPPQDLVPPALQALRGLHHAKFKFGISGTITGISVREMSGTATLDGAPDGTATGVADIENDSGRATSEFTLGADTLTLTAKDGTQTTQPAPAGFRPKELLDEERGIPKLLTSATMLKTEGKEKLQDTETYRVTGELSRAVISALIPGIHADVDVKFWFNVNGARELRRIWLQIPPRQPNEGAVMVEFGLTEQNAPPTTTSTKR